MNQDNIYIRSKWDNFPIRLKLILVCMFTSCIIFSVNIFMYMSINAKINEMNRVYISNINLNELSEALNYIQKSMEGYLNTKNSEALSKYYESEQHYIKLMGNLNTTITDNELLLMEKNIKDMSEAYLEIVSETMQAKRGRNIQKYKQYYEEASNRFSYINTYINSLNNQQFKNNSSNYQFFLKSLGSMERTTNAILLLIIVANIYLIYRLTQTITKPLAQLAESANQIAKGNFNTQLVEVKTKDEVGIVSSAFNQMILSIDVYIEQLKISMEKENKLKEKELIMEGHLKDAQLKYLQAQINPHFLFNTLNAGAQLAMMEDANQTCIFIENMADFFRYNIKKINEDSTLEEEIKLVDNYIYILNVRFVGEIKFQKTIQEKLIKVKVPSMILQPLVENCVNYGIRDIEWEGIIKLEVYDKHDFVYISIEDNGMGIERDKLKKILEEKDEDKDILKNSNGIGIRNVMERLSLYYNGENLFKITSDGINKGTKVIIGIPKKEYEIIRIDEREVCEVYV